MIEVLPLHGNRGPTGNLQSLPKIRLLFKTSAKESLTHNNDAAIGGDESDNRCTS